MSTVQSSTKFTADDLLGLADAVNFELVDGNLVERRSGSESSAIAMAIGAVLGNFEKSRCTGHVFSTDCGYQCFPGLPDKVRKPDVSFVRSGRLPNDRPPEGHIKIAPDLAVEVLSPGDLAYEIDEKVAEYLQAGVKLIWVVSPRTRELRVHRLAANKPAPIITLTEADSVSGEDVLPGFECRVAEFFQI